MRWAQDEFKTLKLGDPRLNARSVLLAERLPTLPARSYELCVMG
ncbi:IS4/Tn5 family transposase DNA-binding protein [Simplicispira psychrophila]|nr:transposase DNA-binding-containing protein [Simplicispira psychrophila]